MPKQTLAERIADMLAAEMAAAAQPPPVSDSRPLAYGYEGAAQMTGLGVRTIRREVRAGRLKHVKVRGRVLITDAELRRYLAEMGA